MTESFFKPSPAIFGVGLIGGSLALSLKKAGAVDRVVGVGRSRANLENALDLGIIDEIVTDPAVAARECETIVLATPVDTMPGLLEIISPFIDKTKVVTDVGSVKSGVVEAAVAVLGDKTGRFVPGHPIAGKEKSGAGSAVGDLFAQHKVVLTPLEQTDEDALAKIESMWRLTGAELHEMDVATHDRVLSITSHLPHLLAYSMMNYVSDCDEKALCFEMAAGGFNDFTRTASSDPVMWRDISLMNRKDLLIAIAQYQDELAHVKRMVSDGDTAALTDYFEPTSLWLSRLFHPDFSSGNQKLEYACRIHGLCWSKYRVLFQVPWYLLRLESLAKQSPTDRFPDEYPARP